MWEENIEPYKEQIEKSIDLILKYGMIDGAHHKQWILDQILRILIEEPWYEVRMSKYNSNEDYDEWDIGIAP
jgi:hypothetical protein